MAAKGEAPIWLRLLFIVIGLLLIVKMLAQDLLPHFGEKCAGVPVEMKQVTYYDKEGKDKGRAIRKTKWHYSWKFKVNNTEYSGNIDLPEKSKKIGNNTTVYYFGPFPWLNCIDTGAIFGLSSIVGVLFGCFFLYLGFHRSKEKPREVFVPSAPKQPRAEAKPIQTQKPKPVEKPVTETKTVPEEKHTDVTPSSQAVNINNQPSSSSAENNIAKLNFCPNCGAKVFGGASFCANCGKKLA